MKLQSHFKNVVSASVFVATITGVATAILFNNSLDIKPTLISQAHAQLISGDDICASEEKDILCNGSCCNSNSCVGSLDTNKADDDASVCRFCAPKVAGGADKVCSGHACGMKCTQKSATSDTCAGGDRQCKFCNDNGQGDKAVSGVLSCSNNACGLNCATVGAKSAECEGGDKQCTHCGKNNKCTGSACELACSSRSDCVGGGGNTCQECVALNVSQSASGTVCRNGVCGVACEKSSACAGAAKATITNTDDNCKYCANNTCGSEICNSECNSDSDCSGSPTCKFCVPDAGGKKKVCIAQAPCGTDCNANPNVCQTSDKCKVCRHIANSAKVRECAGALQCGEACDSTSFCSSLTGCKYCKKVSGNNFTCNGDACNAKCDAAQKNRRTSQCGGTCPFCKAVGSETLCSGEACGVSCTNNTDCAGASDGCAVCEGGVCSKPKASCGSPCANDNECVGALDDCTQCLIVPSVIAKCSTGRWFENMQVRGTCKQVCDAVGGVVSKSPWGNECVSGKLRYQEANDALGKDVSEKWGFARTPIMSTPPAKGNATVASSKYCYAQTSVRTRDTSDVITACYCDVQAPCSSSSSSSGAAQGVCSPSAQCGAACMSDANCAAAKDGCTKCGATNAIVDMKQLNKNCGTDGYYVDYNGNVLGTIASLKTITYDWGAECYYGKKSHEKNELDAKSKFSCGVGAGGQDYICKNGDGRIFGLANDGIITAAAGCVPKGAVPQLSNSKSYKSCMPKGVGNIQVDQSGKAHGETYLNGKKTSGGLADFTTHIRGQYGMNACLESIYMHITMCDFFNHGTGTTVFNYNHCYGDSKDPMYNKICGNAAKFKTVTHCYKSTCPVMYIDDDCNVTTTKPGNISVNLKYTFGSPLSLMFGEFKEPVVLKNFALDAKTKGSWILWRASETTPLVVFDAEKTGKITSGSQLLGLNTFGQTWKDGFEALAFLDTNKDKKISGVELKDLSLWFDKNQNAVSEAGEVVDIREYGITELYYEKSSNDVNTADIIASVGWLRVKDGATTRGKSVDWFTGLFKTKKAATAALTKYLSVKSTIVSNVVDAGDSDLNNKFIGSWKWVLDDKFVDAEAQANGGNISGNILIDFDDAVDSNVALLGLSTIIAPAVSKSNPGINYAVLNLKLTNLKTSKENGVRSISWEIENEELGLRSTTFAELSDDGNTLYGVSRDSFKNPDTLVTETKHYTWVATKE